MRIITIAHNTFRETIRDRILRVIVSICIFVMIISKIIGELSVGQDLKILIDFSLGSIDIFGVILCIFIGSSLIHREMEKKTLYTILSCPLRRSEFILGKYLGMCSTLFVVVIVMGVFFSAYFAFVGGTITANIVGAIFLLFLGLVLLNAIAILFSIIASPSVSIIATTVIFFIGRATYHLKYIPQFTENIVMKYVAWGLYYILPNFNNFDIKEEATHSLTVPSEVYLYALLYMFVYSFLVLYLSSLIINKRNL